MELSPEAGRSAGEEEAPKAIYTTAGTLYNPKSTQPMQAPNRRGRTKWNLSGVPSSELSLLPKSALATLQMRGLLRNDTVPVPEYSPLQQNTDRAVSPSRRKEQTHDVGSKITASPAERRPERVSRPHFFVKPLMVNGSSKRMTISNPVSGTAPAPAVVPASTSVTAPTATTAPGTVQAAEDSKGNDEIELSDSDIENPLRGLSVKSLQNLASYPNPNQKRAQKTLMGGRPMNNGGASMPIAADQNNTRPMTPGAGPGLAPSGAFVPHGAYPPPGLSMPEDASRQPVEPRPSAYYTNISRYNSPDVFYKPPTGPQEIDGGYKTTLAQGPGAPKPLTAGPPGLRQHKASQMEGQRSVQDSNRSQTSTCASDESGGMPGYDGLMANPRQTSSRPGDQVEHGAKGDSTTRTWPLSLAPRNPTIPPITEPVFNETSEHLKELRRGTKVEEPKVRLIPRNVYSGVHADDPTVYDTKTPDAVMKYYPNGLPLMKVVGDVDPNWLNQDHANVRPPWNPGTFRINDAEMERRDQRSTQQFYAGYAQMGGSIDDIIKETERRTNQKSIGVIGDRRPKPAPPAKMTIEEVNAMPTSEVAKPILNMAFRTIMRSLEEEENQEKARKREEKQAQAQAKSDKPGSGAVSGKGAFGKSSTT